MLLTVAIFIFNADINTTPPAASMCSSERLASKGKGKNTRTSSEAKRVLASDFKDEEENSEDMCVGSKDQVHTCIFSHRHYHVYVDKIQFYIFNAGMLIKFNTLECSQIVNCQSIHVFFSQALSSMCRRNHTFIYLSQGCLSSLKPWSAIKL